MKTLALLITLALAACQSDPLFARQRAALNADASLRSAEKAFALDQLRESEAAHRIAERARRAARFDCDGKFNPANCLDIP